MPGEPVAEPNLDEARLDVVVKQKLRECMEPLAQELKGEVDCSVHDACKQNL